MMPLFLKEKLILKFKKLSKKIKIEKSAIILGGRSRTRT